MRRFGPSWLVLLVPVALSAMACADTTDNKNKGTARPQAGASGDDLVNGAGASTSRGGSDNGPNEAGGSSSSGGAVASNGEAGSRADVGSGGEAGSTGDGGAGGDSSSPACVAPTTLPILGDYVAQNGDELWLRDSGKAVTLTRVAPGKPSAAKLPSLWQVMSVCGAESALVLRNAAGRFARLDYVKGGSSLTVCFSSKTADSAELAAEIPAADRANTIDAGCNGGPWTRVVKGGN